MSTKPLLTVKQVSERLGVTVGTTRKFITRGDLASYELDPRNIRVSEEDLQDFLARRHRRIQPRWSDEHLVESAALAASRQAQAAEATPEERVAVPRRRHRHLRVAAAG